MLRNVLSAQDIENMKNHKYKTNGYSWLDNKMNPYWNMCAELLPLSLSPNWVTLIGVILQTSAIIFILFYDFTLSKDIPSWLAYYFILVTFIAQTTDAIDGKHARKTNKSSPLGQLIDHGCDAFTNTLIVIYALQNLQWSGTIYSSITLILVQVCCN